MTDTDKALEIAEHVLLLQSQLEAAKKYILSQPGALSPERLDSKLFDLESSIRTGAKFRELSAEFQRVIQSQDEAEDILHSLYAVLKAGKMTA